MWLIDIWFYWQYGFNGPCTLIKRHVSHWPQYHYSNKTVNTLRHVLSLPLALNRIWCYLSAIGRITSNRNALANSSNMYGKQICTLSLILQLPLPSSVKLIKNEHKYLVDMPDKGTRFRKQDTFRNISYVFLLIWWMCSQIKEGFSRKSIWPVTYLAIYETLGAFCRN